MARPWIRYMLYDRDVYPRIERGVLTLDTDIRQTWSIPGGLYGGHLQFNALGSDRELVIDQSHVEFWEDDMVVDEYRIEDDQVYRVAYNVRIPVPIEAHLLAVNGFYRSLFYGNG